MTTRRTLQDMLDEVPQPSETEYKRYALWEKARALLQNVSSELYGIEAELVALGDLGDVPGAVSNAAYDIDRTLAEFPKLRTPDEDRQSLCDEIECAYADREHERQETDALHGHLVRR